MGSTTIEDFSELKPNVIESSVPVESGETSCGMVDGDVDLPGVTSTFFLGDIDVVLFCALSYSRVEDEDIRRVDQLDKTGDQSKPSDLEPSTKLGSV